MCTVSWAAQKGGYRLFFNRDELRSRPFAEPPEIWNADSAGQFIAPRDPQGGGSWIGVNGAGRTLAVLNYYERSGVLPPGSRSRGELVRELAGEPDEGACLARLARFDLTAFAPFHLLLVDSAGKGILRTWDGERMTARSSVESELPLSTSSHAPERVVERRRAIFRALTAGGPPSAESLVSFHRHYDQSDGPASVCMVREDAMTVSLSDIAVGKREIVFRYSAREPEGGGFLPTVTTRLPRT